MKILVCQTDEQIKDLARLANEIWHEYFSFLLSPEQIDYMVKLFQSREALTKAIRQENYTYFLLMDGETLAGYCGVKPEGTRLFLSKLYLRKDYRGRGLSTKLLNEAIRFAKEQGKAAVYLTCNKYNTHSLDVYKAKGFVQIDSAVTDIGNGFVMDDYIMELKL